MDRRRLANNNSNSNDINNNNSEQQLDPSVARLQDHRPDDVSAQDMIQPRTPGEKPKR